MASFASCTWSAHTLTSVVSCGSASTFLTSGCRTEPLPPLPLWKMIFTSRDKSKARTVAANVFESFVKTNFEIAFKHGLKTAGPAASTKRKSLEVIGKLVKAFPDKFKWEQFPVFKCKRSELHQISQPGGVVPGSSRALMCRTTPMTTGCTLAAPF